MSYDVSKIIEESVKDIIDSDDDGVLQEGEENLDAQGSAAVEEADMELVSEEAFNESRDFLKKYIEESSDGKK